MSLPGTENLVEACLSENVESLIFTSTIDVVVGFDEIVNGDETLPTPSHFLFPGYPDTKNRAEKMVLGANGQKLAKGETAICCWEGLCHWGRGSEIENILPPILTTSVDFHAAKYRMVKERQTVGGKKAGSMVGLRCRLLL